MMLALLLAQLVLPWPGLDSPLVQPGPTICVGECAGPVVWGPAERGRLVVACDMRSDTCSDGRRITTTRATPVPCETSPGVWEMVGVDEGCYGVRGLESWAQTTSYLSHGAELDRGPWAPIQGGAVEVLPDGYRIHPAAGQANSGLTQAGLVAIPAGGESRTLACIVRTHQPAYIRYWVTGSQSVSFPAVDTGGRWEVVAGTREVSEGSSTTIRVGNGPATESPIPFDVAGCWLTRTATLGRPCWGGEAPVTCDADRHTISTEGWPTEAGEICLTATITRTTTAVLLDGRPGFVAQGPLLQVTPSAQVRWSSSDVTLNGPTIARGVPHRLCAGRRDGKLILSVNGVSVPPVEGPVLAWEPIAVLGDSVGATPEHIDGPISSLTVRSYEEVSP